MGDAMKDNSTGKDKDFYSKGKKMFDEINPRFKMEGCVMTNREAMQQALEALEKVENAMYVTSEGEAVALDKALKAITALREALAQEHAMHDLARLGQEIEQEPVPVAWEHHEYRPYGAPGEIRIHAILASQYMMPDGSVAGDFQWLVNEYKKDKNTIKLLPLYTTPPAAQWDKPSASFNDWWDSDIMPPANPFVEGTAAYWAWAGWKAAQRPWQGLTDAEKKTLATAAGCTEDGDGHIVTEIFRLAEIKLKDRNG